MTRNCRWTAFVIPDKLLSAQPDTTAPLLRLPPELLLGIFRLSDPEDQICLALACRRLLQFSTSLSLRIPSAAGHRYLPFCSRMNGLLRRLKPLDRRGRAKKTVALCCDCLRYRPTRKSYWKAPKYDEIHEYWRSMVQHWNSKYSAQCPGCWSDAYEKERERYIRT